MDGTPAPHSHRPFQLERLETLPAGLPLFNDDDPHAYWLLSNARGWKVVLGQNMGKVAPEVYAAEPGALFVGLYHGNAASLRPENGAIIDRVALVRGNMVYWKDYGELIVAVGETEIAVFERGGKFLWRAALGDVIDTIERKDDVFELTDVSAQTARYEARTGHPIPSA